MSAEGLRYHKHQKWSRRACAAKLDVLHKASDAYPLSEVQGTASVANVTGILTVMDSRLDV